MDLWLTHLQSYRKFADQAKFWSQVYAIASSLVEMQADERMLRKRFLEHKDVSRDFRHGNISSQTGYFYAYDQHHRDRLFYRVFRLW